MVTITPDILEVTTRRLVEELRPERVYLFGSHAYGVPRVDSDLDLAVILPRGADPDGDIHARARRAIGSIGCGLDLMVYTADRFDQRSGWRANLEHTVRNQGRLLFGVDGMNFCREWLIKSMDHLRSAELLMQNKPPYVDNAAFHCQQAAEKALKAYLVHRNEPSGKTHDLGELRDLCATADPTFSSIRSAANELTRYAVRFRHPGEPGATPEQVAKALDTARWVWDFVLARLPGPLHDEFAAHLQ